MNATTESNPAHDEVTRAELTTIRAAAADTQRRLPYEAPKTESMGSWLTHFGAVGNGSISG